MKTKDQIEFTPGSAFRRGLAARTVVASLAIATTVIPALAADVPEAPADGPDAIRPFHINIPKAALTDLHRRLLATKWPDKETVTDDSQGVQLATMKKLVDY